MPSTAPLVKVYVDALCGRAICVHGALNDRAAYFGSRTGAVARFWFARPAHAGLVASRCFQDFHEAGVMRADGWIGLPPFDVVGKIDMVARQLGAKWQTEEEIQRDAKMVVAEILARVEAARRGTGLKDVNYGYKVYRLEQKAKGEKAVPYSAHLAKFTRSLVIKVAQESMQ
jgi:hypothetical protein